MKRWPTRVPTRPGDPAAVVGVVLAGIVAMVVSPGRFDWWASMIGLTLIAVLWGYAHEPTSFPESVGLAAAIALSLIWTIGAPLEIWFGADLSGDGELGDEVFVTWLVAAVVTVALLELRRGRRGVGPMSVGVDPPRASPLAEDSQEGPGTGKPRSAEGAAQDHGGPSGFPRKGDRPDK